MNIVFRAFILQVDLIVGTGHGIQATEQESEESKMADVSSPNPSSEPEKPAAESSDSSAAELQKTISDAFDIFDHESNKTVDVRCGNFAIMRCKILASRS